ncbi:MAG: M50 family metallopeptidase [Alphaproteobacteria bacterium]|nr:M50 family metallopeptidase [Alphaproteobacteria bacterium]
MINWFLALIKWPIAVLMMVMIFPAFQAIETVISQGVNSYVMVWFVLPFVVTSVGFFMLPFLSGSFLAIMEHELTHMLFAILTGHKPVDLEVNQNKGGYLSFQGEGNWLIALAPYFFPTFAFVVMLASLVYMGLDKPLPDLYWAVFGVMCGYHLASTILEIHPKQTDFKAAGYIFTMAFLPGINLIVYGVLLSYACAGWSGIPSFLSLLMQYTGKFIGQLISK